MRWKLFYNVVAIAVLAGSYAEDEIIKSSVGNLDRRVMLHTPGQHFPSPAQLLQGYVPPKEIDTPTTKAPAIVPHKTPSLVVEEKPKITIDNDKPDISNNQTPKLPPVQVTPEQIQTTTTKNFRTPRSWNFDSTTPSVTSTSKTEAIVACVDTTTSSSIVATKVTPIDPDFARLPAAQSPLPRLPPMSKPLLPSLITPSPLPRSSSTQPPPLPPQYIDQYITSPKPAVTSISSIVTSSPLTDSDLKPRYPPPPRVPPPRFPIASNSILNIDSALNHPTPKPSLVDPPASSKFITYPNQPAPPQNKYPPPRLPLTIPTSTPSKGYPSTFDVTSDNNIKIVSSVSSSSPPPPKPLRPLPSLPPARPLPSFSTTTENNVKEITSPKPVISPVYPISPPGPRLPPPRLSVVSYSKPNQNSPIYYPAGNPSLPTLPLPNEPTKYPNIVHPSIPQGFPSSELPSRPSPAASETLQQLPLPSLPVPQHPAPSVNPPTPHTPPSRLPIPNPNPIITIQPGSFITTSEPSNLIAPTSAPSSLLPSDSLLPQPHPLQVTPEINTRKPAVTIIYPDQTVIISTPSSNSVQIPTAHIPTEKTEIEITQNKSSPTVAPKEVKRGDISFEYGPIPSPNGIDKYRMVVNGYYFEMNCPQGLHFNPINARCDWPLQVSCNTDASLGFKCPSDGIDESGNPIVLNYKYEGSCTQFYSCQAGYARVLTCRPGYAFSTISSRCEKADQVYCKYFNIVTE